MAPRRRIVDGQGDTGLPYEASSGDATTSPAAIVATTSMPAVTASASDAATATPASIAATTTHPAATTSAAASTAPDAIPVAATMPAVTATGITPIDATATPASITSSTTHPAATYTSIEVRLLPRATFSSTATFDVNVTSSPAGYTPDGVPAPWVVVLVDRYGVPVRALENASITQLLWSLNEPDACTFTLPTLDPANDDIIPMTTEVQVWWDNQIFFFGPVVRPLAKRDVVEYQCLGADAFLGCRIIGREKTNMLTNGSFESGIVNWFAGMYVPSEPPAGRDPGQWAWSVTNTRSLTLGGRSLFMASTDVMTFGIRSIQWFDVTIDPAVDPGGIDWTLVAWVWVPSATFRQRSCAYNWNGDAAPSGASIVRLSTTEMEPARPDLPKLLDVAIASITDDTPKDQWTRLEVTLNQPAGDAVRTDRIQIELGVPIGEVYWDEVSIVRNERLAFNEVDQATIVETLVQHAQDPAYGKTDLNIDTNCPLTGITRTRAYEFFNHEIISDVLDEFSGLWRGMDHSLVLTATTRTYTTHFPMKGARRPALALVLGRNISDITIPTDGSSIGTRIVVMSDSSSTGAGREEAWANDPTAVEATHVLEMAINAVKESSVQTLQDQADRALRQYRVPPKIPTISLVESPGSRMVGVLQTGDVLPVIADYGALTIDGEVRVTQISFTPGSSVVDVTVNPFEEWNDPTRNWGVLT